MVEAQRVQAVAEGLAVAVRTACGRDGCLLRGNMKFRTTILQSGKSTTGIQVPEEIVESLGAGKQPPVRVTLNGYTYRSTIARD